MLNYRESADGINFPMKPLGLVRYNGSTANNIVLGFAGGVGITLDEDDPDCRFKALGTTTGVPASLHAGCGEGGAAWCSKDGLHWSTPHCVGVLVAMDGRVIECPPPSERAQRTGVYGHDCD